MEPQGVGSLMAASIMSGGEMVGFLGVDNPQRNTGDLLLLSVAASACYSEISSSRLKDSRIENQYTAIIGSLSSVFFALYYIDLEENTFQELISLDNLHHMFGEKGDAKTALKQINGRQYYVEMRAQGVKEILQYGIAFSGKSASVKAETKKF